MLMSSGLPFTIVKPCGLSMNPSGTQALVTGHDDGSSTRTNSSISRGDVAQVMAQAVSNDAAKGLRFDLCASHDPAPKTMDWAQFFQSAHCPWGEDPSGSPGIM